MSSSTTQHRHERLGRRITSLSLLFVLILGYSMMFDEDDYTPHINGRRALTSDENVLHEEPQDHHISVAVH